MRRAPRTALVAGALVCLVMGLGGCGSVSHAGPTIATPPPPPRVQLVVADRGQPRFVMASGGARGRLATSVPAGSVLAIVNRGARAARVQGTMRSVPVFDTGSLGPGQQATVVLGSTGVLTATVVATGADTRLTVTPARASS
jgi:hypothetical protein